MEFILTQYYRNKKVAADAATDDEDVDQSDEVTNVAGFQLESDVNDLDESPADEELSIEDADDDVWEDEVIQILF